jgi:CrcB protein
MKVLLVVICIAFGGAFGAVTRHLGVDLMHLYIGIPSWIAVMIINITGCYLIGLCFFYLEASLRRTGGSRLRTAPLAGQLDQLPWWPDGDPTQPAVDLFRRSLYLDLLSGLFITGFMGAFTTFSLFSLHSLLLVQQGQWVAMIINALGSAILGFVAVYLGLHSGRIFIMKKHVSKYNNAYSEDTTSNV